MAERRLGHVCVYCEHEDGPDSPNEHHGVGNRQKARLEEAHRLFMRVLEHNEAGQVLSGAPLDEIHRWIDNALPWEQP